MRVRNWMMSGMILAGLSGASAGAAQLPTLVNLQGESVSLEKGDEKRLIVFWATWCDECRAKLSHELPLLDQRADVSVVTINTDRDENRAREFVKKEGITLPVLRDPEKKLRSELKVFSVPHWAVYRRGASPGSWELVASEPAFNADHVQKALQGS